MPTYDYRCRACGHEFELFQQMTAPVKRKCPECSQLKLERLIGTGAGILFKGDGFYETDYRSESYRKAAEAEKKSTDETKKKDGDGAVSSDSKSNASSGSGDSNSSTRDTSSKSNETKKAKGKPASKNG